MAEQCSQGGGETDTVVQEACNLSGPVRYARPPPERVLEADEKTPDDWVPRSPELIRLTGAPRSHRAASRHLHAPC